MPITIKCPRCGHMSGGIPDKFRGKSGRCPKCDTKIDISACDVNRPPDPIIIPKHPWIHSSWKTVPQTNKPLGKPNRREDLRPYRSAASSIESAGMVSGFVALILVVAQFIFLAQVSGAGSDLIPLVVIGGIIVGIIPCWLVMAFGNAIASIIRLLVAILQHAEENP